MADPDAEMHWSVGSPPDISCVDLRAVAVGTVIQVSLGLHDAVQVTCLCLHSHELCQVRGSYPTLAFGSLYF